MLGVLREQTADWGKGGLLQRGQLKIFEYIRAYETPKKGSYYTYALKRVVDPEAEVKLYGNSKDCLRYRQESSA